MTETERIAQLTAELAEARADAEDAWRHAHEAERDLELARQQLLDTASAASRLTPSATRQASAGLAEGDLMVRASLLVAEAFNAGLAEGEKRRVRAVELTDDQGQRGTLIGPADKIDSVIRPEAVVREDGAGDWLGGPIG